MYRKTDSPLGHTSTISLYPFEQPSGTPSYPQPPSHMPIAAGTVTYTTSTGPDGRVLYHPYGAVAASYQTSSGIVSGIQWVPAEATYVPPPSSFAQLAGVVSIEASTALDPSIDAVSVMQDFAASIGQMTREDENRSRHNEVKRKAKEVMELPMGPPTNSNSVALGKAYEHTPQASNAQERFDVGPTGSSAGRYAAFPSSGEAAGFSALSQSRFDRRHAQSNSSTNPFVPYDSNNGPYSRDEVPDWRQRNVTRIEEIPEDRLAANIKAIVERLTVVFESLQQYKRLLSYRNSEAQQLLDGFQMLLETPRLSAKFRRNLLVATQRLSKRSGLYPTCYNLEDIELASEHPVAAGSFADIYKGRFLGQDVCLKVIRLYQTSHVDSFLKQFSAEAILWSQLSHPNLLSIYGLYRYTARLCLVSPWMEYGDVNNFLQHYPDANRPLLVSDVASGVAYLHKHDIVHGDLKGANILVNGSKRACVADFGLSAVSDTNILHWTSHSSAASKGGSIRWQAPELFDVDNDEVVHNSKASDIYAFSCVAYEICTGNIPFFELARDSAVMLKIKTGSQPSRPPAYSPAWGPWGLTEQLWSLMAACWNVNPEDRPTIQDIITQHALKQLVDNRPAESRETISPAHFRYSMSAQSDAPSIDDLMALMDSLGLEV